MMRLGEIRHDFGKTIRFSMKSKILVFFVEINTNCKRLQEGMRFFELDPVLQFDMVFID